MIKKLIILTIISLVTLISYGQQDSNMNIDDIKLFQEEINYPYSASEERANLILANMNKLEKGMTKNQVIELLTAPDEVNLSYKSIKSKDNIIGFSLVYILRRNVENGSIIEKNEKLLRIHFDDSGKLIWNYSIDY
jgi:hypothetical protein